MKLRDFLHRMGREAKQGAIGLVIDVTIWKSASHWRTNRRRRGRKAGSERVSDMAKNIEQIAAGLGAKIVGRVPDTGRGAFGASRLAHIVESLQARLVPGQGKRPGRPSDATWVRHPKVPMSEATTQRLRLLAEQASTAGARSARCRSQPRFLRTHSPVCGSHNADGHALHVGTLRGLRDLMIETRCELLAQTT